MWGSGFLRLCRNLIVILLFLNKLFFVCRGVVVRGGIGVVVLGR